MSEMILPLVRSDALPVARADDGCGLHPSCLSCPLPVCQFDAPKPRRMEARNEQIRQAYLGMETSEAIARRFGVSRRQVIRICEPVRALRPRPRPAKYRARCGR